MKLNLNFIYLLNLDNWGLDNQSSTTLTVFVALIIISVLQLIVTICRFTWNNLVFSGRIRLSQDIQLHWFTVQVKTIEFLQAEIHFEHSPIIKFEMVAYNRRDKHIPFVQISQDTKSSLLFKPFNSYEWPRQISLFTIA